MIRNYIKTALRNIARNKVFSAINFIGFSVGIAIFVFIMLFVQREYSYNKFNEKTDRIYRMEFGDARGVHMTSAMGPDLHQALPEIKKYCRYKTWGSQYALYNNKTYNIEGIFLVDSTFTDIFTVKFLQGNPQTALEDNHSVILTKSLAQRIFQGENPMGKTLTSTSGMEMTVTGVIEDFQNFYLQIRALMPFNLLGEINSPEFLRSYGTQQFPTFLLLEPGTNIPGLENKINAFFRKKFPDIKEDDGYNVNLRPLDDVYFADQSRYDFGAVHGSKRTVTTFIAIGVFILVLACINFVNLTTARAASRANEVGMRKVHGARRRQLIGQFISESVLITFISFLVGLTLVQVLLPSYNNIIRAELSTDIFMDPWFIALSVAGILLIGTLAGIYPAFYLTAWSPVQVLNGEKTKGRGAEGFRRFLIVFQFTISVALIISTITVHRQLQYMKNKELGFNEEHVVTSRLSDEIKQNMEVFKEQVKDIPGVQEAAYSFSVAEKGNNMENYDFDGDGTNTTLNLITVDPDYIPLMDIKMLEGENFSYERTSEKKTAIILNEAALKESGLKAGSAAGTVFHRDGWYLTVLPSKQCKVIGVVEDFHFRSMHEPITPLGLVWNPGWHNYINIRVKSDNLGGTIGEIRSVWENFSPDVPFNYSFLSQEFDNLYQTEERLGRIFNYFSILAIIIAIMGLYGMSTYVAESKTREIGIRKAMGSTVNQIILLLGKNFMKWVVVAILIAAPIAWYAMESWLSNFAYKIRLTPDLFILGALVALFIAALTISFKSWKAASLNPADSLRYE
jgi:putative ABC transport system permease protein